MHNTVGIDVERHLNLGHATRRGGDAYEVELTQHLVVCCHVALTLQHLNANLCLVVSCCGKFLALLGWDGGVTGDEAGEDTTQSLDAEGQGSHVEKQNVLDVALEHASLDRSTHGHNLVRVDTLSRIALEEVLDNLLHTRHTRHATDQ
mmetsp:Transcript_69114/g.112203  ORF Transcript_69114/g.112203 Transcript_69114/m.112203 type:complete len:148 (-) Transcript_69114:1180-1623(-)